MTAPFQPRDESDVCEAIAQAGAADDTIEIVGGGTKRGIATPGRSAKRLSMAGMSRVIDYDPAELVLTLEAGALLDDVETMLRERNQMLAFDPWDFSETIGLKSNRSTIGGVVGAGLAGSRRISAGGVRDHVLGFAAVNGRGEAFKAGGRVVKNVTGYDLSKLVTGAWGQLVVLTQMTLKVMPLPQHSRTLVLHGLDAASAGRAMNIAMNAPAEVAAAAYLPNETNMRASITTIRVEGFGPSVDARATTLSRLLMEFGKAETMTGDTEHWRNVRNATCLHQETGALLWRISVPPSRGAGILEEIHRLGGSAFMDWAGGLVWARTTGEIAASVLRALAETAGGHAVLADAPEEIRAITPALHPESPGVAALSRRVREAFDPMHVFDPLRFETTRA